MVAVYAKYLGEAGGVGVHHGPTVAEGLQQGVDGIQPAKQRKTRVKSVSGLRHKQKMGH